MEGLAPDKSYSKDNRLLPQEFISTGRFGTSMSARRILGVPRVGLIAHKNGTRGVQRRETVPPLRRALEYCKLLFLVREDQKSCTPGLIVTIPIINAGGSHVPLYNR